MPPKTTTSSPGASSTGFAVSSPSLQAEEGFRQRSKAASPKWQYLNGDDKEKLPASEYDAIALILRRQAIHRTPRKPLVDSIKNDAAKTCSALELATSTVTSLPHFMADGFNRETINGINLAIEGLTKTLDLAITALEGIIIWLIHVYRSTYRCMLELAANASVNISLETVSALQQFTTTQLGTIKSNIDNDIGKINSELNSIRGAPSLIGVQIPTVSIPSADALNQFDLPTNLITGVTALNNSIPTMADIESKLDSLISVPFDDLRNLINSSMSNIKFNESLLPVPPKNNVEFCAQHLDLSVLDELALDLVKAARVGIVIIAVIGLLMILGNEIYVRFNHWRFMVHVERTTTTIQLITITHTRESVIEIIKIADHPLISRWIIRSSKVFSRLENRNLYRWFWDYILHRPAVIVLLMGLSGVLGIYVQILILNIVRQKYKAPVEQVISAFGNAVESLVNSQLNSTSVQFADSSNSVISDVQNVINQDLFGWVNITTTALNNTLNSAVEEITGVINTVFGGVPILANAVQQLVGCLILVKIQGIQEGLKFISDNAYVELPRVDNTVLMLSQDRVQDIVSEATNKLVGPTSANSTSSNVSGGEIGSIFDQYEQILRNELYVFWIMIGVYGIVILMGFIRVAWFVYKRKKNEKKVTYVKDQSDDEKSSQLRSAGKKMRQFGQMKKLFKNSVSSSNNSGRQPPNQSNTSGRKFTNTNILEENVEKDSDDDVNNNDNLDIDPINPFSDINAVKTKRKRPPPPLLPKP
ncbi:14823_t:CDS:2, partial [Acaulospora colombiana]